MPRQGDGSSDNGPFEEAGHNIMHGTGTEKSDHVSRADKAAPMPEYERGGALPGLHASGGGLTLPSTAEKTNQSILNLA
ncbi:hypothetical protein ACN47E_007304 [Coniothyrium glycines]